MQTFAGQVHRALIGDARKQQQIERSQHFILDMPIDEVVAFGELGRDHLLDRHIPYAHFSLSLILNTPDGVATPVLILVESASKFVDRKTGDEVAGPGIHIQAAQRNASEWCWLNYTSYISEAGVIHGFVDKSQIKGDDSIVPALRDEAERVSFYIAALIGVLSCKNVTAEISDPAPSEAVNRKREANGKARIFDTHTLVVHATRHTSKTPGDSIGSHSSPRQHLRRGHIRRLPGGNIWVQACVVGDAAQGFLNKTYRIAA